MTNIRVNPHPLILLPFAELLLSIVLAPLILYPFSTTWKGTPSSSACLRTCNSTVELVCPGRFSTMLRPTSFLAGNWASMDNAAQMSEFIAQFDHHLVAISLGTTCFRALTFIGNGPNLLVKAIAEHEKVKPPSFVGHAFKFALPVLAPIF